MNVCVLLQFIIMCYIDEKVFCIFETNKIYVGDKHWLGISLIQFSSFTFLIMNYIIYCDEIKFCSGFAVLSLLVDDYVVLSCKFMKIECISK